MENGKKRCKFQAFEYRTLRVKEENASKYRDCFQYFGWQPEEVWWSMKDPEHFPMVGGEEDGSRAAEGMVTLRLKRERRIPERQRMNELQRQCEGAFAQMEKAEAAGEAKALIVSLSVGLAGAALVTGAVFAFLNSQILLFLLCAIPGFAGCVIAYFAHVEISNREKRKAEEQIERLYEQIDLACEEAERIWNEEKTGPEGSLEETGAETGPEGSSGETGAGTGPMETGIEEKQEQGRSPERGL